MSISPIYCRNETSAGIVLSAAVGVVFMSASTMIAELRQSGNIDSVHT